MTETRAPLFPTKGSRLTEPWIDRLNGRADALRKQGAPVISLGQAVPGIPPPASAVRAFARAAEHAHGYTADAGTLETRQAAADWLHTVGNGVVDPADGLIITAGGNQAFAIAALTAFQAQDDVLLVSPYFFNHEMTVRAAGANPIEVPTTASQAFGVDVDRVLASLTPRTRAVVLVTPANPTGAVVTPAEVERLARALAAERVFLIVDETYLLFKYDAPPWSATALSRLDNVIVIGSFSKAFAIPGWRLGYLAADPRFVDSALRVQDATIICPTAAVQAGVAAALRDDPRYPLEFLSALRKRRDAMRGLVEQIGGEWTPTGGGFFAFARLPGCGDSFAAANHLLEKAHVLTIPGALFGRAGEGFLRLSFGAAGEPDLKTALTRIAEALNHV